MEQQKKLVEKQQKIYDKKNSRQKNMEKLNLVTGFFFITTVTTVTPVTTVTTVTTVR